jgi:acid phosphatase
LKDPNWTAALEQITGYRGEADYRQLPPAVILDLDETVLDNSAMQGRLLQEKKVFNDKEWGRWVKESRAALIPGAIDFLITAHAHGVAIYYVTNRVCNPQQAEDPTIRNLKLLNIPFHPLRVFCKTDTSDKSPRRAKIAAANRVLLLLGDDFNDFVTALPPGATVESRREQVRAHDRYWGERWFMFPNAMYGSWERVLEKDPAKRLSSLRN